MTDKADIKRARQAFQRNKSTTVVSKAPRDRIALGISIVSLTVAVLSAFFNVLLLEDDIRVVIGRSPMLLTEKGELILVGRQDLTFINSGNRSAVFNTVKATARVKLDDRDKDCDTSPKFLALNLQFDIQPVIAKGGEIVHVTATPVALFPWKEIEDEDLLKDLFVNASPVLKIPKDIHEATDGKKYLACLHLGYVVPDSYRTEWKLPVYEFVADDGDLLPLFEPGKPVSVFARRSLRGLAGQ